LDISHPKTKKPQFPGAFCIQLARSQTDGHNQLDTLQVKGIDVDTGNAPNGTPIIHSGGLNVLEMIKKT
jgi:hypothetical protein